MYRQALVRTQAVFHLLSFSYYLYWSTALAHSQAIQEKTLGENHEDVAGSLDRLAEVLREQGQIKESEAMFRRGLEVTESAFGPTHAETAASLSNLALALDHLGKSDEAEQLFRRALRIEEEVRGPRHPEYAISLGKLGRCIAGKAPS